MGRIRAITIAAALGLLLSSCTGTDNGQTRPAGPEEPGGATSAVGQALAGSVPWWNDAVFYEVFVRSFKDSDSDGNGDLRGLIDSLDYLNDGDPQTDADPGAPGYASRLGIRRYARGGWGCDADNGCHG